jgi:hypothetical protein
VRDLKVLRRYSDWEWIIVVLLSVSVSEGNFYNAVNLPSGLRIRAIVVLSRN